MKVLFYENKDSWIIKTIENISEDSEKMFGKELSREEKSLSQTSFWMNRFPFIKINEMQFVIIPSDIPCDYGDIEKALNSKFIIYKIVNNECVDTTNEDGELISKTIIPKELTPEKLEIRHKKAKEVVDLGTFYQTTRHLIGFMFEEKDIDSLNFIREIAEIDPEKIISLAYMQNQIENKILNEDDTDLHKILQDANLTEVSIIASAILHLLAAYIDEQHQNSDMYPGTFAELLRNEEYLVKFKDAISVESIAIINIWKEIAKGK